MVCSFCETWNTKVVSYLKESGQYIIQKITFCVPRMKESHRCGLERHAAEKMMTELIFLGERFL